MCLRRIEGVTRKDRVRNEEVMKTLGQEAVMTMSEDRLVKKVYMNEARGKRPCGRT